MTKTNPHLGSTFESWLDETGIREEVTSAAVASVIAAQAPVAGELPDGAGQGSALEPNTEGPRNNRSRRE
ncbi:hypothetical protein SAMN05519104_6071 [Rhizobiales bacterium GAS188]|nr:hypothetical protein SAMN05519104_6071 [Rhizobiales bacterium GAS188]